jgi:hypothetical protein
VDLHPLARVLVAQRLDLAAELAVVQRLAGFRVVVQQRHVDDAGAEVTRHQLADLARALDVRAHLGQRRGRAVVGVAHHGVAVQAVFGDGHPAGVAGPQRFHERPVHAGQQVDRVAQVAQGLEVLLVEDRLARGRHRDAQRIALAGQVRLVGQVVGDVRVLRRQRLFEAGVELQPAGLPAQQQRGQQADQQHPGAVVEQQPLGPGAGAGVEVFEAGDDGLGVDRGVGMHEEDPFREQRCGANHAGWRRRGGRRPRR